MEATENKEKTLTYEQLMQLFQKTEENFQKSEENFQKSNIELTKKFNETEQIVKENAIQMKETDRKIKKLSELYGNVSKNNGDVAESFFYRGLKHGKTLGGIKFHAVDRNNKIHIRDLQAEFDIILTNTNTVAIVEVKYKVHPNDVEKLKDNLIPVFKQVFQQFSGYYVYGVIAGFDIPEDCIEKAKEYGFFILTQSGKNMEVINQENIISY